MLGRVKERSLSALCATAEAIPLRDGSVDVITAAQAFHWFRHADAVPEMRRVLRSGGVAGILWNLRDESAPWVAELSEIIGSEDAMKHTVGPPATFASAVTRALKIGGSFESCDARTFPFAQELTEEGLVGLVRSRSYVAILPDDERDELLERVRHLVREHPDLRGRERFQLPYQTRVFRAVAP
jgi:SAM-dependent methyltransferase